MTPAERRARFRRILERAVARADREHREHLDRLRPARPGRKPRVGDGWRRGKRPRVVEIAT
jgi:hypothetical protein